MNILNCLNKDKNGCRVIGGVTVTAHAGAMHTTPNTLGSIKKCIQTGADIIEVDVTLRRDGTFVLIHKSRAADNQGVPFSEFLTLLSGNNVRVNLDLKAFDNLRALQDLISADGKLDRVFFTGVGIKNVSAVKESSPEIPYFLNAAADIKSLNNKEYAASFADGIKNSGAIGLNSNYLFLSRTIVNAAHDRGLLVSAWTVNGSATMRRLVEIGVDNITTKNPVRLQRLIGK